MCVAEGPSTYQHRPYSTARGGVVSGTPRGLSDDDRMITMLLAVSSLTFDAHCCHMGTAIKPPVPDRVKPSFVIFDIQAL